MCLGVGPKPRRRELKSKHLENPARSCKYRSCFLVLHSLDLSKRYCQIPWDHNAEGQRESRTNIRLSLFHLVPFILYELGNIFQRPTKLM